MTKISVTTVIKKSREANNIKVAISSKKEKDELVLELVFEDISTS